MQRPGANAIFGWWRDPAWRLVLVAALLSAGKVLLYTTGTTLFLARQGIEALPLLYLALAAIATAVSLGLAVVIDRAPRRRLLPGLAVLVAIGTGGLVAGLVLNWSLAPAAILIAAHVYDIITDIVFWVLAAALVDNLRLRRLTTRFYLAIAAGGSAAGILAERALVLLPADHLLWPVIGLSCLAALALGRPSLGLGADGRSAEGQGAGDGDGLMRPGELRRFLERHPFALLLALNSLLLTAVYSLTEYLAYAIYADTYQGEAELGRFLALLFAALQLAEFAVLWFGARRVIERAGPLLRNLLFPLTSFVCLLALLFQPRLGWAILAHVNTEAVSNGVFEPVNATNYGALPVAIHGRARTLADGIFYPIGMAMAGLMLALLPTTDSIFRATVLALVTTAFFIALNLVVARRYLPTLLQQVRHGLAGRPDGRRGRATPRFDAIQLVQLTRTGRRADLLLALDLLEATTADRQAPPDQRPWHLDLAALLPDLSAAAPRLDDAEWVRLAAVLATLEPAQLRAAREAAEGAAEVELLATAQFLAGQPLGHFALSVDPDSYLAALTVLGSDPPDHTAAWPEAPAIRWRLAPVVRRAPAAVLERLAGQPRLVTDDILRRAFLDALCRLPMHGALAALEPFVDELRHSPLPAHRAAALRCMARTLDTASADAATRKTAEARFMARLALAWPALAEPSRTLRAAAIEILLPEAKRALERIARGGRLADPNLPADRARGLIELLAAIGDRPAQRRLRELIANLASSAERDALLLQRLAEDGDPALAPLRAAVLDHAHEVTGLLFAGLAALGDADRARQLQDALREVDARLRAGTIDGLASLRHGILARRFMPLLEQLHLSAAGTSLPPSLPGSTTAKLLDSLASAGDRWLRTAVALARSPAPPPGWAIGPANEMLEPEREQTMKPRTGHRSAGTNPALTDSATLVAILRLKRFELFAELPFDVLETVLHLVEERQVTAGMLVQRPGGPLLDAWLVDRGSVVVEWSGGQQETLGPDSYVGETALVDPTVVAPSITATSPGRLFRLHRVAFQDLAREHPVLTEALCRVLARAVNRQRMTDRRSARPEPEPAIEAERLTPSAV